jgi:serine/threonine protein kinase
VLGKVGYLSPEQQLGMPATPASDEFALGVVLHELLAGEKPRPNGPDEPPGVVPRIRELRPEVPAPVEAAVVRALSRRAAERFHRLDELELALRQASVALPPVDLGEWLRARFPRELEAAAEEPSLVSRMTAVTSADLETRRLDQA